MKKIFQYICLLLMIGFFSSCDLDTNSTTDIEEELVYTTTDNVDLILNGTWKYLMETFNSYANPGLSSIFRASDAMGSDVVVHFSKYGYKSHYQFLSMHTQTSGTVTLSWLLAYRIINNCNNIITKIDQTEGSSEDKARIKGQAYALRGYMYLNLASFYSTAINVNPNAPLCTDLPGTNPSLYRREKTGICFRRVCPMYFRSDTSRKPDSSFL